MSVSYHHKCVDKLTEHPSVPPQKFHIECTSGTCSPADMAKFSAYVNEIKNNPNGPAYDVYSEITQITDDDDNNNTNNNGDQPPKHKEDDTVSIQQRDVVTVPTAAPIASPNPIASPALPASNVNGDGNVQVDEATKGAMVDQAKKILVHCSSAEGGCSPEQVAQIENSIHAAGWGFLKPIFDLIGKFKFNYGLEVGGGEKRSVDVAAVDVDTDHDGTGDGEYTTPVVPVPDVPKEREPMVSTY